MIIEFDSYKSLTIRLPFVGEDRESIYEYSTIPLFSLNINDVSAWVLRGKQNGITFFLKSGLVVIINMNTFEDARDVNLRVQQALLGYKETTE